MVSAIIRPLTPRIATANKCYYYEEEEFVDYVMERYQEKRRYADFLEAEGSIMAESSRANQGIFRMKGAQDAPPQQQ